MGTFPIAVLASIAALVGALLQAYSSVRSMNALDANLFKSHAMLEEEHVRNRVAEVYRARFIRRRLLARQARKEVESVLTSEELDRLRVIQAGLLGWSVLVVGSAMALVATLFG